MVSFSLKVDLPKDKFIYRKWLQKIANKQRREAVVKLRKLFQQTTFGWKVKPSMGWSQTSTQDEIVLRIYATGPGSDIWNLLNQGAPRHDIPLSPKVGGFLRFKPGYRASTTPGVLKSRRAYRSGKFWYARQVLNHPGIEPRRFTELIAHEYALRFGMDMQEAMTEAAQKR